MTKKNASIVLTIISLFFLIPLSASSQTENNGFSRGKGFVIRPELYGAVLGEVGYQINPHFQFSVGGGVEIAEQQAIPELVLGIRAYATDTKWTAFFDYHMGILLIGDYAIPGHRFTIGPSYKNFDFGGGILYMNFEGVGAWGFCLNIGYNFRIGK